jgi:hypothetical protein
MPDIINTLKSTDANTLGEALLRQLDGSTEADQRLAIELDRWLSPRPRDALDATNNSHSTDREVCTKWQLQTNGQWTVVCNDRESSPPLS